MKEIIVKKRMQNVCTLSEIKHYLRVDFDDDDALLQILIQAAQNQVEQHLNCTLIKQSYKINWRYNIISNAIPAYFTIILPKGPILSLDRVFDMDRQENIRRVSFDLETINPYITIANTHQNVEIHYTAGYGEAPAEVPQDIVNTIKVIVADLYRHRDHLTPASIQQKIQNLLGCYLDKRLG